jgi:glutamine synthetase
MRRAGVIPDSFLAEYGPRQYEVTSVPAVGLRAADNAVITRELARAVAYGFGERVSFSPIPTPAGIGNGTHIHWSFLDRQDQPVLYDERRPWQLSQLGESFIAGIVRVLPALCAVTAPSIASYYRLRPDRWAPTCADAAPLDRGAALRICPVSGSDPQKRARQFNIEYRVADATASPYLALAMLIQAGLDGVRSESRIPAGQPRALPDSLAAALTQLERVPAAADWMGADLLEGYVAFKRAEIDSLENLGEMEICNRYAQVY